MVRESVRWRPPPRLVPYVTVVSGYRQSGGPPGRHRGLPSPNLSFVVALDEGLHIARHSAPSQSPDTYDAVIGGLHATPMLLTHDGAQAGIYLGLTPLGSRALFAVPAAALADVDVHASDVVGAAAGLLREHLLTATSWSERFEILQGWLEDRVVDDVAIPGEVEQAWRLINTSRGTASVAQLGDSIGWSTRHLRSRFAAEIGLTPKAAARVVRFDRSRWMLQRRYATGAAPYLARLAAVCGYSDQAHLAREFRDLAGCSATEWLRTEFPGAPLPAVQFPNVQAAAAGRAAGSAS
jgi:AraC-like DNA-binding protein